MTDITAPISQMKSGAIPMVVKDNEDGSYSLGVSTVESSDTVTVLMSEICSGKYFIHFIEADGGYLFPIAHI